MGRKKYKNLGFGYIVSSVVGYAEIALIARKVKAGNDTVITKAAVMIAVAVGNVMPRDRQVVLVSIPDRTGRAGYTKTLTEKISEVLHLPAIDALVGNIHDPLCLVKKANGSLNKVPLYFYRIRRLPRNRVSILIDSVFDIRCTTTAIYETIGRRDTLMAIPSDTHEFTSSKRKSGICPLIDNNMTSKKKEEVQQQVTLKGEPTIQTEREATRRMTKLPKSKTLAELYENMKEMYPDAILLFRTGNFYTTLNVDVSKAADTLGLEANKPAKVGGGSLQVTFPYHALGTDLPKLIRAGLRMAIVNSLEKK